jgi:predicted transcriptional regulator
MRSSSQQKDKIMIKEKIDYLVATLQALTLQRQNALRIGKLSEAQQIASVAQDVDARIHQLQQSLKLIRS